MLYIYIYIYISKVSQCFLHETALQKPQYSKINSKIIFRYKIKVHTNFYENSGQSLQSSLKSVYDFYL